MALDRVFACILAVCAASAQAGVEPKAAATDYPVHAAAGEIAIGAEYLVHSYSHDGQTYFAPDYLVVEIGLFPQKGREVPISSGQFMLRINGKKDVLLPEPPGFVGASLKYSDWERKPRVETGVGIGGADVIIGRRVPTPRFPGDRREEARRTPPVIQAPGQVSSGVEREEPVTPGEAAVASALPDGSYTKAAAGNLYFRYSGKTKSIKKLELLFRQGEQETTLRLM